MPLALAETRPDKIIVQYFSNNHISGLYEGQLPPQYRITGIIVITQEWICTQVEWYKTGLEGNSTSVNIVRRMCAIGGMKTIQASDH